MLSYSFSIDYSLQFITCEDNHGHFGLEVRDCLHTMSSTRNRNFCCILCKLPKAWPHDDKPIGNLLLKQKEHELNSDAEHVCNTDN